MRPTGTAVPLLGRLDENENLICVDGRWPQNFDSPTSRAQLWQLIETGPEA